jgi:hypothetical protein
MKLVRYSLLVAGICVTLVATSDIAQAQQNTPAFVVRPSKVLTDPYVELMSQALILNPHCTVLTEVACTSARKTLKELPTMPEESKIIAEKVHMLLLTLKQFFAPINSFSRIIKPLVEESLLGSSEEKYQEAKKAKNETITTPEDLQREYLKKNSVLLGFLDAPIKEKDSYFEHRVTTKLILTSTCAEFVDFFNDLIETLHKNYPETYNAYIEARKAFTKSNKKSK